METETGTQRSTPWLTIAQAAERLQVSTSTVYEAIATGKCRAIRLGIRRAFRIHVDWLDAYSQSRWTVVNPDAPGKNHNFPGG